MELLVGLIIGGFIGWRASVAMNRKIIEAIIQDLKLDRKTLEKIKRRIEEDLEEESELSIRIESHSGQLYAYRKDTDEFLAQGSDGAALIAAIKALCIHSNVIVAEEDGAEYVK